MSQFWQNLQVRLQPAVPNDSTGVPGRKWLSGFFSIGSTQKPDERPQVASTISPPSQARTKHRPRWPSLSLHSWRHTSQRTRQSGSLVQCRVGRFSDGRSSIAFMTSEYHGDHRIARAPPAMLEYGLDKGFWKRRMAMRQDVGHPAPAAVALGAVA